MAERVVTITGDKKLAKKLSALTKQAKNPIAIHKRIGLKALGDVNQQFVKEGGQFGKKWKPLKAATIKRRRAGSSRILQDTGRLRGSANFDPKRGGVIVGFSDKKAEWHQFGTKPRKSSRRIGSASGKRRTAAKGLPARPMLPMGNDLNRYVQKTVIPLVQDVIARMIR